VCVCVCVCMYVCMYVCNVCVCVCMYVCMYVCMHACMHACTYLSVYMCVYNVYVCVCVYIRECIQKFPDWVDNEIYAYNNKHSSRSNTKVLAAKLIRLTHKIAIQLHLVAESCTICVSRSRWPVRKLLDTPSRVCACVRACMYFDATFETFMAVLFQVQSNWNMYILFIVEFIPCNLRVSHRHYVCYFNI
jgi:hypothetical protein